MKKLNLKPNAVNKGEVLTRAQLKKVMGGMGSEAGSGDGAGNYKCCYNYPDPKDSGCSECKRYSTTPTCPTNIDRIQGVLTSC